ncbi:MAG: hypothetical protein KME17_31210, partial [Cyanosarcina radialis HA8281-LM2]|nr:hypothetical protein [Cyanosarcina radialis HA8281-LM2]
MALGMMVEGKWTTEWNERDEGVDLLPRMNDVGFKAQAGIAVCDCLTSPNLMVEAPTILIFLAA